MPMEWTFGRRSPAQSHSPALYAESFAPLLDFGWSPLKSVREGEWKYIDAPKPELFHLASDQARVNGSL